MPKETGDVVIATLGSHSALQIMHGAKREGFKTLLVVRRDRLEFYREFSHLIDYFIEVDEWRELCSSRVTDRLMELNAILVPHGSFIEYVGLDCLLELEVPIFGSRRLMQVESNIREKMSLLREAGIPTPREYSLDEEFPGPVIVKLPGAKGGRGYFIARDRREVLARLGDLVRKGLLEDESEALVQEFIVGTPAYYHFFYSPIMGRLELMGMDIRYESIVDGLRRLPPELAEGLDPSFVVVGNIPLVLRESLLYKVMEYGRRFVEKAREKTPPGAIGPFSLESIIRDDLSIVVFEFSGRIVAGTNLYMNGSPYSTLYWNEPMSMGRRIAREIRLALDTGRLEDIIA